MLEKLTLQNYRCYEHHTVSFRDVSVVVGKNNAGKSTLVEALRLLQIVISRYKSLSYNYAPKWTNLSKNEKGVSPSLVGYDFVSQNLFNKYGESPALIIATFKDNSKIEIYIGDDCEIHSVLYNEKSKIIDSKAKALLFTFHDLNILPQVMPLQRHEKILSPDYVRRHISSNLSSLHFRNQIALLSEHYESFKILAEKSWPGLRLRKIEGYTSMPGSELNMLIQDEGFVAEIAWMGHGLQMWLQTMWFLARNSEASTVILDEPDVYMHPDLQRRLIRMLKLRYKQIIIATHSVEIMSEVEPENILVIDRARPVSVYASNFPAVQRVIDSIGSIHNLQLAKLWSSRKLLIFEGKDIKFLKRVHAKIFAASEESFDSIPRMEIGGWGGWNYALGSKMFLKNAGDENIIAYSIFDSDYHLPEEIEARYKEAKEKGVQLHVWKKKEIENYFIVPEAICRVIKNISSSAKNLTIQEVLNKINEIVFSLEETVMDNYSSNYSKFFKGHDSVTANRYSRNMLKKIKVNNCLIDRVSGKEVMSRLSFWSKQKYGVSLTTHLVTQEIYASEFDKEILDVIETIEKCVNFSERSNFEII